MKGSNGRSMLLAVAASAMAGTRAVSDSLGVAKGKMVPSMPALRDTSGSQPRMQGQYVLYRGKGTRKVTGTYRSRKAKSRRNSSRRS